MFNLRILSHIFLLTRCIVKFEIFACTFIFHDKQCCEPQFSFILAKYYLLIVRTALFFLVN